MVLGIIIIGLSSFTDAAKNLLDLVIKETRPDINGVWTVEITYPQKNISHIETFNFEGTGNEVHGHATYLEKNQAILEGKIINDRIEFKTKTREYAPDWDNDDIKLATHHYRGRILGNEIEFVMETYGGFSADPPVKFTARKSPNIEDG